MQTQDLGLKPTTFLCVRKLSISWGDSSSAAVPRFIFSCRDPHKRCGKCLENWTCAGPAAVSCLQTRPLTLQILLPSSSTSRPTLTSGGQVTAHSATLPPSSQCQPACLPLLLPSPSLPSSCRHARSEPYRPKICRRAAAEVECDTFCCSGTSTRFSSRTAIAMWLHQLFLNVEFVDVLYGPTSITYNDSILCRQK